MLALLKNNKGEVSTLVVVGLLVLVGVGVLLTSTLNQNAKTAITQASNDGPGGQCDMGDNGGCGGPNGCRFWEYCEAKNGGYWCNDTTNRTPTAIEDIKAPACKYAAINYPNGTSGGNTGGNTSGSCMQISNIGMDLSGGKVGGIKVYRSGGEGDVKIAYMNGTSKVHLFGPSKLPDGAGDTNELIAAAYNSAGGFFDTYALPSGSSVKVLVEVSPVGSGSICQTITYTCTSNGTSTNCAVGDTGSAPPPAQPTSPPAQNPPQGQNPPGNVQPTSVVAQPTIPKNTPTSVSCRPGQEKCPGSGKCVDSQDQCDDTQSCRPGQIKCPGTTKCVDFQDQCYPTPTKSTLQQIKDQNSNPFKTNTPTPIYSSIYLPALNTSGKVVNSGTVTVNTDTTSTMCTLTTVTPGCTTVFVTSTEFAELIRVYNSNPTNP